MKQAFRDSGTARFYLWVTKAKITMGIFYAALVFFYLFLGYFFCTPVPTLDLFTSLQMLFACLFIGILQQAILPVSHLTKLRCTLWVGSGMLILLLFHLAFGWFDGFPLWCILLLFVLLAVGMIAIIVSYYLDLHRETTALNQKLAQFQQKQ